MFKVTIIDAKKSIIRITILIVTIVTLFLATQIVTKHKSREILQINISEELIKCLNSEIPAIETTYYNANNFIKEDKEEENETLVGKILGIELAKIQEIKQEEIVSNEQEIQTEVDSAIQKEAQPKTIEVSTNVPTQIVTKNPIAESFNIEINGVKIKNETSFRFDNTILNVEQNINKQNI